MEDSFRYIFIIFPAYCLLEFLESHLLLQSRRNVCLFFAMNEQNANTVSVPFSIAD